MCNLLDERPDAEEAAEKANYFDTLETIPEAMLDNDMELVLEAGAQLTTEAYEKRRAAFLQQIPNGVCVRVRVFARVRAYM